MRLWNLKPGDPLSPTIAADARQGPTDYCDDQIWELSLEGGDPPALALQTTYGLRARLMRIFPRFTLEDVTVVDPSTFSSPPAVHQIYPNLLALSFAPFPGIDVSAEYWVPQSNAVVGRLEISNHTRIPRTLRLDLAALLTPIDGERMAPQEIQAAPLLAGKTGNLCPVVFVTGGPQVGAGSYPSLSLNIDLTPGSSHIVTWAQAALLATGDSFHMARQVASRPWESERARLELQNAGLIDIYTGNPDWDAVFALSQKLAFSAFVGPTGQLPFPSFVLNRAPDQGYSRSGDGNDYNHLWNGQPPLEAYYLSGLVLPAAVDLLSGILRNYLATQVGDGFIDWKPGLGGQRSRLLATPVLATLAWRIYQVNRERSFLEDIFPPLLNFLRLWFTPAHDRDGDGIPEWDHPMQAGAEESPIFTRWHPWSQGVEISTAESPSLCAFLYRECRTLIRIAQLLERPEPLPWLHSLADHLKTAIDTSWNAKDGIYQYWDRDTHLTTSGQSLGKRQGAGEILVGRAFPTPLRLHLKIHTGDTGTRRPQVCITTATQENLAMEIPFHWYLGTGSATLETPLAGVERIKIEAIEAGDQVEVFTVDLTKEDQTLLLPLWAGIPTPKQARQIMNRAITNPKRFGRIYGLPMCPHPPSRKGSAPSQTINLLWNTLVGEGMVRYGYRQQAADLVTSIMNAIVSTIKRDKAFRHDYHADTGQGSGQKDDLLGLAPLGLFLETLGVRLISPQQVELSGFNPFPWPVTVKYRGLTVLRQREKSMVIFADGQTIVVRDPAPQVISLQAEPA